MKKVYIISLDMFNEVSFTSKKKALKQYEIIKKDILNGDFFPYSAVKYDLVDENETNTYYHIKETIFKRSDNNKYYTLRLQEMVLNNGYKM